MRTFRTRRASLAIRPRRRRSLQRDGHREDRHAADAGERTIQRIHDPAAVQSVDPGSFLTQEPDVREPPRQRGVDAAFGGGIGRRHGVLGALEAHAARVAEMAQ
jgi:hypothetical protein